MKCFALSCVFVFLTLDPPSATATEECRPVDLMIAHFEGPATGARKTLCRHGDAHWSEAGWEDWHKKLATKQLDVRTDGFASPGLKYCERLGGKAITAKFSWDGKEIKSDFCAFATSGWLSLNWLEENYRNPRRRGR